MSLHLFPTPVECQNCGTVVEDASAERCPRCGELLKERRTPARLAGVERRYDNLRLLLGFVRFLGVTTGLVGVLVMLYAEDGFPLSARLLALIGSILIGTFLFVAATAIEIAADIEENTRSSFRILQALLHVVRPAPPES